MKLKMVMFVVAAAVLMGGAAFASDAAEQSAGHEVKLESSIRQVAAGDFVPADALAPAEDLLPFRLDDYVGFFYRGKPILDLDGVIGQIDRGTRIKAASGKITYGFLHTPGTVGIYNNPNQGFLEPSGYEPFSAAQKDAARLSMALWDDLVPQQMVEMNGLGADLLFANTTSGPAQAWAYYPGQGLKIYSDVWIHTPASNWSNNWLNFNGYGLTTIIHEAGHSLGLSHPGAYNFRPGLPLSYVNNAEYAQDSEQYSIMSYWPAEETGAFIVDWRTAFYSNEQAPLVHDIHVVQSKYGADLNTRSGDTVYGFNSTADRDIYDFQKNPFPYLAIYDAGGNDTLDLSGSRDGVFLDLRPGSISSASAGFPTLAVANAAIAEMAAVYPFALAPWTQAELDLYRNVYGGQYATYIQNATGVAGVRGASHWNLGIAYATVIENAIGGPLRDLLIGNDASNSLTGNGGSDVIDGLGGDDTLTGGPGADSFRFGEGMGGTDTITDFDSGVDKIDLSELGLSASDVQISGGTIDVDNGDADFRIIVRGEVAVLGDIVF